MSGTIPTGVVFTTSRNMQDWIEARFSSIALAFLNCATSSSAWSILRPATVTLQPSLTKAYTTARAEPPAPNPNADY